MGLWTQWRGVRPVGHVLDDLADITATRLADELDSITNAPVWAAPRISPYAHACTAACQRGEIPGPVLLGHPDRYDRTPVPAPAVAGCSPGSRTTAGRR